MHRSLLRSLVVLAVFCGCASPSSELATSRATVGGGARRYVSLGVGPLDGCATTSDGALQCWTFPSSTATTVAGLSSVLASHVGITHRCALGTSGVVSCWGDNAEGQLGDGTTTSRATPAAVSGSTDVVGIGGGELHTCAIVAQGGAVKCWGHNARGQLGDGTTTRRTTPTLVPGLSGAVAVVGGFWHSCALLATGQVKCWGENASGQLGDGTTTSRLAPTLVAGIVDAVELAAGSEFTCARLASGQVKCWGENGTGALGDGTRIDRSLPTPVTGLTATAIAAGYGHSCAVVGDGTVRCWGTLGASSSTTPVAVPGLVGVVRVDGGGDRTCALRDTGLVQCWNGATLSTVSIAGWVGNTPSVVAARGWHTCAVLPALGTLKCWGQNDFGQLGIGSTTNRSSPASVGGLYGVRQVVGGYHHTCALVGTGVRCWGRNTVGQLGNGTTNHQSSPATVNLTDVVEIAGGGDHNCALLAGGTVKCWGHNGFGQLGDGSTTHRLTPVAVSGLSGAIQIVAGGRHSCALLANGQVRCWGDNHRGMLGDGSTTSRSVPVPTVGLFTSAVQLATGDDQTCALLADGTVQCWGANAYGQVGDGTTVDRLTPTDVYGLLGYRATAITAGGRQSCALRTDGGVSCWGLNDIMGSALVPTTVQGVGGAIQVSASEDFACVRRGDGTVWCWGDNSAGQLGIGAPGSPSPPVQVVGL